MLGVIGGTKDKYCIVKWHGKGRASADRRPNLHVVPVIALAFEVENAGAVCRERLKIIYAPGMRELLNPPVTNGATNKSLLQPRRGLITKKSVGPNCNTRIIPIHCCLTTNYVYIPDSTRSRYQ